MARFTNIHCYPYSGWHDIPWGLPRPLEEAPTDDELDVDAAARSARRVTESVSAELAPLQLQAGRGQCRIGLQTGDGSDVLVRTAGRPAFASFGGLQIPRGFRFLSPGERTEILGEAIEQHLDALCEVWQWDREAVGAAARRARDLGWSATFEGPWKRSRDRRTRVRLVGRIHDDGYARWRIHVSAPDDDTALLQSDEVLGWTWIANMTAAAKGMRFLDGRRLEVPPGSGFLTESHVVDLDSGAVDPRDSDEQILTHPGDPTAAPPRPRVVAIAD